jgi:hypothetical protein
MATVFSLITVFACSCGGGSGTPNAGGLVGFATGDPQVGTVPSDGSSAAAPKVTAVQISNNPAKNGDSLHVSVTFSDPQGDVAKVNVGLAGQTTYSSIPTTAIGNQTSGTLFLELKPSTNSPGTYTLVVSITDAAGNTSVAATQTFTILNPDGTVPGASTADGAAAANPVGPLDGGAVPVATDSAVSPDLPSATGYWELTKTDVFDKLAATDTNYGVTILSNSISCTWSMGPDVFTFTSSWTTPPTQIRPTDKVPMNLSVKLDQNIGSQYSANGNFDVFFDRPECEPGSVIAAIGLKGAQGETGSFTISHLTSTVSPPVQVFINGKDLPAGAPGARIALMVVAYNGRSVGVRYIYAWKTP